MLSWISQTLGPGAWPCYFIKLREFTFQRALSVHYRIMGLEVNYFEFDSKNFGIVPTKD